jgi:L-asparaginase II
MPEQTYLPLVEFTRGAIVESIHCGVVVVSDHAGNILFKIGDENLITYLRSTAKPLQVLALLEHPEAAHYHFEDDEIAIMCASHSGTDEHVAVLKKLQEKVSIDENDLQCGTHLPFDRITANQVVRGETRLSTLQHNCSGKHSGMLALAKLLAEPKESYLSPDRPTQQLILQTCGEMLDVPFSRFEMGIDGCSAPVFAVPMRNAAQAYARLCQPDHLTPRRMHACRCVTRAMMAHPFLVAGPERFDTAVMQSLPGKLIAKTGAEGFFGIGIMPDSIKPGSPGIGIMVKICDGDLKERARPVVCMTILRHLGLLTPDVETLLKTYDRGNISNWRDIAVGEVRPSTELLEALQSWKI